MTLTELHELKKTVIRNKRNLEFSTTVHTEDLLRLIELAERELRSSEETVDKKKRDIALLDISRLSKRSHD